MTTTVDAITAVRNHHAELEAAVRARVEHVLADARSGRPVEASVASLSALVAAEVVPHARAEEEVLYAAANPRLYPLVAGMILEHETLLALSAELSTVGSATDAAGVARAFREIFVGHVRRENELLLPALAADPTLALDELLPVMHDRFTFHHDIAVGHPSATG